MFIFSINFLIDWLNLLRHEDSISRTKTLSTTVSKFSTNVIFQLFHILLYLTVFNSVKRTENESSLI